MRLPLVASTMVTLVHGHMKSEKKKKTRGRTHFTIVPLQNLIFLRKSQFYF